MESMDRDDVDGGSIRRKVKLTYFQNVQSSLLMQTRRLTAYLTSDDKNATKALQQAMYTAISTFFLIVCLAIAVCIYLILEPFLRPLLWALLCGTILHPLKKAVTERFKVRLDVLTDYNVPLLVGIFISPIVYLTELSGFLEMQFSIHRKIVIGLPLVCVSLFSALPYHHVLIHWLTCCLEVVDGVIITVDPWLSYVSPLHILTIFIGCALVNYFGPARTRLLQIMSSTAWVLVIVLLVSVVFGSIRAYALACVCCLVILSLIYEACKLKQVIHSGSKAVQSDESESTASKSDAEGDTASEDVPDMPLSSTPVSATKKLHPSTISSILSNIRPDSIPGHNAEYKHADSVECNESSDLGATSITTPLSSALLDDSHTLQDVSSKKKDVVVDDVGSHDQRSHDYADSAGQPKGEKQDSKYRKKLSRQEKGQRISQIFFVLILVCVVTLFYHNPWIACCLLLPVICTVLMRKIILIHSVYTWLEWAWLSWKSSPLCNMLFPPLVCNIYSSYSRLDKKIQELLRKYSDSLISAVIVIGLVLVSIAFSILLLLQLRADITHYTSMSARMLHTVRATYPQLDKMLSSDVNGTLDLEEAFDHMTTRGYQYGRQWLKSQVKSFMDVDTNNTAVDELIRLLDNVYISYRRGNNTADLTTGIPSMLNNGSTQLMENARGLFMNNFQSIVKMSSHAWKLLSTQLNFAISMATAIISVLFSGGTVVLNFIVSVIVFVTTLYYLLNASGAQYLPVKWISNLLPTGEDDPDAGGTAFTMAIRSVFAASLKTATFYGLYTWLIHAIFGMQTAVLSAALAAVAGAIPFIGTYWASLPAVLELWLVHDQQFLAVVFLGLHILPTTFVDYLIYEDLESGHPYLTGLAIVGGFYYAGLEGAILGPILLCCLLFFQHLYESVMSTNYY